MPTRKHITQSTLIAVLTAGFSFSPAIPKPNREYIEVLKYTFFVSCYEDQDNSEFGSRLGRSNILVSPDGLYRAYTEAEALVIGSVTTKPYPEGPSCVNTSRLFVSGRARTFELVFMLEPTHREAGNGIQAIDFSSDSRLLLVAFIRWAYQSEWCCPKLLLYDTKFRTFTEPDERQAFSSYFGKKCDLEITPQGFSREGKVVVKAFPWDEDMFGGTSCVKREGLWLLDPYENRVTPLPHDYQVQRYGKIEDHEAEE